MEALNFRPEAFEFEQYEAPSPGGCGCSGCRQQEFDESEFDDNEFDDNEYEWETKKSRKGCSADTPDEVEECGSERAATPILCGPTMTKKCPAIPLTWQSKTIGGVPFFYKPKLSKGRHEVLDEGNNKQVNLVPKTWRAAQSWVLSMNGVFNMRISAVYTLGAGRYCRCVKRGPSCSEDYEKPVCTGLRISNHGFGDALDIVGVRWVDPKGVGKPRQRR